MRLRPELRLFHLLPHACRLLALAALLAGTPAAAGKETVYNIDELYPVTDANHIEAIPAHQYLNSVHAGQAKTPSASETLIQQAETALQRLPSEDKAATQAFSTWQNMQPKLQALLKKEQELAELVDYMSRLKNVSQTRLPAPKELTLPARDEACDTADHAYRWPRPVCPD